MFRPTGCNMPWITIWSDFWIGCCRWKNRGNMNRCMLVLKIDSWLLMWILDLCSKVIIRWLILLKISLERIYLTVWNNAGSSKWSHVVGNLLIVLDKPLSLIERIHVASLRAYLGSNHTFWLPFFSHHTSLRVHLIVNNPLHQRFHDRFNRVCKLGLASTVPLANVK